MSTTEEKATTGQIIWETIVGLTNDERSITRQVLRDATGLSYDVIDDHIKRLETAEKVIKVGKGLIEIKPLYPEERVQSLVALPNGKVKWEMGDLYAEFTPPEIRRHAMLVYGFARQYEDIEGSNKALIRTAELAHELRKEVAARKALEAEVRKLQERGPQLDLLESR